MIYISHYTAPNMQRGKINNGIAFVTTDEEELTMTMTTTSKMHWSDMHTMVQSEVHTKPESMSQVSSGSHGGPG